MIVAIPSKGRAGSATSPGVVPSGVLFVPAAEESDYRRRFENVVPVPDEVRGITPTRNWILTNTDDPRVVFVDDDVETAGWVKFYSHSMKHRRLPEPKLLTEFEKLFDLTEELGLRLWGVATMSAPRAVYPYNPIIFRTYVTASCCGLVNDGRTLFDESFAVKEDYELCLRLIREDGGIVGARYLYWQNSHWGDPGGCHAYRTMAVEQDCIRRLVRMYPGMIKQVKRGGSGYSVDLNF